MGKKYFILIVSMLLFINCSLFSKEVKCFSVKETSLYAKPTFSSTKIVKLPAKSFMNYLAKTDYTSKDNILEINFWHKVKYKKFTGWVHGAHAFEYSNQNIDEFIKRIEFVEYMHGHYPWRTVINKKFKISMTTKFDVNYLDNIDEQKLELRLIPIIYEKNGFVFSSENQVILKFNKLIKKKNGFELYNNKKFMILVNVRNNKLKILKILNFIIKAKKNKINSQDLKKYTFQVEYM